LSHEDNKKARNTASRCSGKSLNERSLRRPADYARHHQLFRGLKFFMRNTVALPSNKWDLDPEFNSRCWFTSASCLSGTKHFSPGKSSDDSTKMELYCTYSSSVLNIVLLKKGTMLSTMLSVMLR